MSKLILSSATQLLLFVLPMAFVACEKTSDTKNFRFNGQINVDGRTRTYLLNLPPSYYDTSGFSLVIALHGTAGSAEQCERDYGITEKGNAEGFIVVYPEGVPRNGIFGIRTWNAGNCCDFAKDNNIDDVHFITVLIDELVSNYKINPKKVYVTGMSNGAMLAYRLACEIPDKVAAIGSVSGDLVTIQPCSPARPVPILEIHSILDTKVPYEGGIGLAGYYFPPVDSGLNVMASVNACKTPAQVVIDNSQYKFTKWIDCNNAVTIECYLTQDGGHAWPGGKRSSARSDEPSMVINATDIIWDFFKEYSLP